LTIPINIIDEHKIGQYSFLPYRSKTRSEQTCVV